MKTTDAIRANTPSPLQELTVAAAKEQGVELLVKRDDLIHPDIPGNKYRKLLGNLEAARLQGAERLVTFGGAYSNHIRAVAAAGSLLDIETVGLIRGEEHLPLNPTLEFATKRGMELRYVDRDTYRRKTEPSYTRQVLAYFPKSYLIPEGGSNTLGVAGCSKISEELPENVQHVFCPVGTGGTLAGISQGAKPGTRCHGIVVLKGAQYLEEEVADYQREAFGERSNNWDLLHEYHFGGFAKFPTDLSEFVDRFAASHDLRLERVYVSKLLFGVLDLVAKRTFAPGDRVVTIITG